MDPFDLNNKKREAFLEHSDYAKVYEEHLMATLQRLMPTLSGRLSNEKQECSLYLVDAKNGLLEIPLLKNIIKQRGSIKEFYLTCQGVSGTMRKEFIQRAIESELGNLVKDYQVVSFEDPLYTCPMAHLAIAPDEWFDIVSWKNTPREHNSLIKFRNSFRTNGAGLLVFPYHAGDRSLLLQEIKSAVIAGEEVVEELVHLEVRHQGYILETIVNTECCFQRGRFYPNQEGELLLSYVLQVEWTLLSPQVKKNIGEKVTEFRAHYGKQQMILQHLFIWIFSGTPHERALLNSIRHDM